MDNQVTHIKFELFNSDEIKSNSVFELTKSKKLLINEGSIYDAKMGTNGNSACVTCGCKYRDCPGHFGFSSLAIPVYHPLYVIEISHILRCFCYFCNSPLISKPVLSSLNMVGNFKKISNYCVKAVCLNRTCLKYQPTFHVSKDDGLIYVKGNGDGDSKLEFTASRALVLFQNIDKEVLISYGIKIQPQTLVITALSVLPTCCRPPATMGNDVVCDDDLTTKYIEIAKINEKLNNAKSESDKRKFTDLLRMHVCTLMNNEKQKAKHVSSSKPIKCIKSRIDGKSGLLRSNLMGKRVDQCGRTVAGPEANCDVDQIVLPQQFIDTLTVPVRVYALNIASLQARLDDPNDKSIRFIQKGELTFSTDVRKINKNIKFKLAIGDVIERKLTDGDIVLLNRQPTLHTGSFLALKVKTQSNTSVLGSAVNTIRMNLAVTASLNCDYDGDELNIHVPQSEAAITEATELMSVWKNTLLTKAPIPLLCLKQDAILGAYIMSMHTAPVDVATFNDICSIVDFQKIDHVMRECASRNYTHDETYSSRTLISLCFPSSFNYKSEKHQLEISNGLLLYGAITKSVLSSSSDSIPKEIMKQFKHDDRMYMRYVSDIQYITTHFLDHHGFSVGLSDCFIVGDQSEVNKRVDEIIAKLEDVIVKHVSENLSVIHVSKRDEPVVMTMVGNAKELGNYMIKENLDKMNNLRLMIECGSKGNYINCSQITCLMGQQIIGGKRVKRRFKQSNRVLPHYTTVRGFDPSKSKGSKPPLQTPTSANTITPQYKPLSKSSHLDAYYAFKRHRRISNNDTVSKSTLITGHFLNDLFGVVKQGESSRASRTLDFIKDHIEEYGFVSSSLLKGLKPHEFFFHAQGGREGILDTACKTGDSGYIERKLVKILEDNVLSYNGIVMNEDTKRVSSFSYSTD
jgi:DNA-directed RNA polymerase beta' subunit